MESLVSTETFQTVLGYSLSEQDEARAKTILEIVSGEVKSYCNAIAIGESQEDMISVPGSWNNMLKIPGAPVHDVHSVDIDDEPVEDFDFTKHGVLISPNFWGGPGATVNIVYTHGIATVPGDVQSVVISRAMRMFVNPHGLIQQRLGSDHSVSYAADAEAITGLNKSERMTLARYRRTFA